VLILCAVLFAGSRDALGKYRDRSRELMGQISLAHAQGETMTNGVDHHQGSGKAGKPPVQPKSQNKPDKPGTPKEIQDQTQQAKR
jgi:hypothetical protein